MDRRTRIIFEGNRVAEIELHPLALGFGKPLYERGLPTIARGEKATQILTGLAALSKPFGTSITIEDGIGRVVLG
jgi:poly-gamma-glutamate synthesis protein (capsule biosynthesis protein)